MSLPLRLALSDLRGGLAGLRLLAIVALLVERGQGILGGRIAKDSKE
jgi:hypothetical protein